MWNWCQFKFWQYEVEYWLMVINYRYGMPSVLWHCWLGGRKGIWPVKTEWWGTGIMAWLSVWNEVQIICIGSSWCHCHLIISCSSKIQYGLPFWCRLTQVVLEKRLLNGCSSNYRDERWTSVSLSCWLVSYHCVGISGFPVNENEICC